MKHKITKSDVDKIHGLIQPLIGEVAWDARIDVANFLSIEFGKPVSKEVKATSRKPGFTYEKGEWSLMLYSCQWRIEHEGLILASSPVDSKNTMRHAAGQLNGLALQDIQIEGFLLDAAFRFSNCYTVRTFSTDKEDRHWSLTMPENKVFAAGPNASWSYRSDSKEIDI